MDELFQPGMTLKQRLDALDAIAKDPTAVAALKYRFDELMRYDAQIGIFFAKQLEVIRTALYEKKYPEFKARSFLPIKNDLPWGARLYTTRTMDEAGEPDFVEDMSDEEPMFELTGASEDSYKMREIRLGYGWGIGEAEAAIHAGVPLEAKKANGTRKSIERFIDKHLLLGHSNASGTMYGLFTLAGGVAPTTYTPTVTGWDNESPDDMFSNLMDFVSKVINDTKEQEIPNTMIIAPTLKQVLQNRRMGDANNMTVLKFFLESQEYIKSIETSHYLESGAGHGGSGRRSVVYRKDADCIEGLVNEMQQLPPEYRATRVKTICRARVGGVMAHRPKSVGYMDAA